MKTFKNLYVINRDEWRTWLEKNHKSKKKRIERVVKWARQNKKPGMM